MAEQSRDRQRRQGDEAPPTLDIDGIGGPITDLIPGGPSDGQNFFACPGGATGNVVAGLHIDPCERRELFAMTREARRVRRSNPCTGRLSLRITPSRPLTPPAPGSRCSMTLKVMMSPLFSRHAIAKGFIPADAAERTQTFDICARAGA